MLGFKQFDHAAVTISGIELAEKIKKGQCAHCGNARPVQQKASLKVYPRI
jgi:hypothetical protein